MSVIVAEYQMNVQVAVFAVLGHGKYRIHLLHWRKRSPIDTLRRHLPKCEQRNYGTLEEEHLAIRAREKFRATFEQN